MVFNLSFCLVVDNVPTLYRGEVLFIRREKIRLIAKIGGFYLEV